MRLPSLAGCSWCNSFADEDRFQLLVNVASKSTLAITAIVGARFNSICQLDSTTSHISRLSKYQRKDRRLSEVC